MKTVTAVMGHEHKYNTQPLRKDHNRKPQYRRKRTCCQCIDDHRSESISINELIDWLTEKVPSTQIHKIQCI